MTYTFRNTKYKQLQVHTTAGKVRFVDGAFSTDDEAVADALLALGDDFYGVQLVETPAAAGEGSGSGPEDEGKPPARSANKDTWVAWAVAQGASGEDAAAATKEQLIEQYGGRTDG